MPFPCPFPSPNPYLFSLLHLLPIPTQPKNQPPKLKPQSNIEIASPSPTVPFLLTMKRSDLASSTYPDLKLKKIKVDTEEEAMMSGAPEPEPIEQSSFIDVDEEEEGRGFVDNLDENLLYEILKHVDARSLAMAGCVSKLWHKTAQDERLWELICTRHWANIGCTTLQLRGVVLALGGFRRLHSLYLWPLSKPAQPQQQPRLATPYSMMMTPASQAPVGTVKSSSSSSSSRSAQLGKDEVQLSLSLFSIRYFEKMNFTGRGK